MNFRCCFVEAQTSPLLFGECNRKLRRGWGRGEHLSTMFDFFFSYHSIFHFAFRWWHRGKGRGWRLLAIVLRWRTFLASSVTYRTVEQVIAKHWIVTVIGASRKLRCASPSPRNKPPCSQIRRFDTKQSHIVRLILSPPQRKYWRTNIRVFIATNPPIPTPINLEV